MRLTRAGDEGLEDCVGVYSRCSWKPLGGPNRGKIELPNLISSRQSVRKKEEEAAKFRAGT